MEIDPFPPSLPPSLLPSMRARVCRHAQIHSLFHSTYEYPRTCTHTRARTLRACAGPALRPHAPGRASPAPAVHLHRRRLPASLPGPLGHSPSRIARPAGTPGRPSSRPVSIALPAGRRALGSLPVARAPARARDPARHRPDSFTVTPADGGRRLE